MKVRVQVLAAAAAGLTVAGLAGPAVAAPELARPDGNVKLYSETQPARPLLDLTYGSCLQPVKRVVTGRVGSFRNQPPANCQVVLSKPSAGSFILCAGSGVVPQPLRSSPQVTVRAGRTVACPPTAGASNTP